MTQVVEIYAASSSTEAHLLLNRLAEHGIVARVVGDTPLSAVGEVVVGYTTSPRIWVSAEHAEAARDLLAKWKKDASTCTQASWKCPICTAEVDAGFEVCWSCQRWRDE